MLNTLIIVFCFELFKFDTWGDGWTGAYVTLDGVQYTLESGSTGSEALAMMGKYFYNCSF